MLLLLLLEMTNVSYFFPFHSFVFVCFVFRCIQIYSNQSRKTLYSYSYIVSTLWKPKQNKKHLKKRIDIFPWRKINSINIQSQSPHQSINRFWSINISMNDVKQQKQQRKNCKTFVTFYGYIINNVCNLHTHTHRHPTHLTGSFITSFDWFDLIAEEWWWSITINQSNQMIDMYQSIFFLLLSYGKLFFVEKKEEVKVYKSLSI